MKKYCVTFSIKGKIFAGIEVFAMDENDLHIFIDRFYPDTNWDYWEVKNLYYNISI